MAVDSMSDMISRPEKSLVQDGPQLSSGSTGILPPADREDFLNDNLILSELDLGYTTKELDKSYNHEGPENLSRRNFLTTRMIESLKNKNALKLHGGRMVYGHVYSHNDHTHVHGHVHTDKSANCQLDLESKGKAIESSVGTSKIDLADFEPNLVTVCCDRDHDRRGYPVQQPEQPDSIKKQHEESHNHTNQHHLHVASTAELDLINSCFDFDVCDNVSCNNFVCDEFIHGADNDNFKATTTEASGFEMTNPENFNCPIFLDHNHEFGSNINNVSFPSLLPSTSAAETPATTPEFSLNTPSNGECHDSVHDMFVLNPTTNELKCVACQSDNCTNKKSTSHWKNHTFNEVECCLASDLYSTNFSSDNVKEFKEEKRNKRKLSFNSNFVKNKEVCRWDNCSTTVSPNKFRSHLLKEHFLPTFGHEPLRTDFQYQNTPQQQSVENSTNDFECGWGECDYQSHDLYSFFNHVNESHITKNQSPDFDTPTVPKVENNQLKTSSSFTTCQWHASDKHCGLEFKDTAKLTEHIIETHIGAGKSSYVCHWKGCDRKGKTFTQRQKIIRHLHVHTKHKPFKCDICGHSFSVNSMLLQHKRVHSGEKPYKCKFCNKSFATSSSLSIHIRIHTGEKPLLCKFPGCDKRFSESSNLAKHMRIHEKKYKCSHCIKSFDRELQLKNHVAKHVKK